MKVITTSGINLSIRYIEHSLIILIKYLEQKKRITLLTSDTDSSYICFDKLVDKVFKGKEDKEKNRGLLGYDYLTDKIEPFIDKSYQELIQHVNKTMNKKIL